MFDFAILYQMYTTCTYNFTGACQKRSKRTRETCAQFFWQITVISNMIYYFASFRNINSRMAAKYIKCSLSCFGRIVFVVCFNQTKNRIKISRPHKSTVILFLKTRLSFIRKYRELWIAFYVVLLLNIKSHPQRALIVRINTYAK